MSLKRLFPEPHLIVPAIVACALFMENLDSTILATAVPTISRALQVDPLSLNMAITAYLIAIAVFIPISGWVADRFGTRRVFQASLIMFSVSSLGCGLAHNLLELVAARIVQGMGGAMMVPVGRLLVLRSVPKNDLVRAMAYVSTPAMVAPLLGPVIGGFILSLVSWRWLFLVNLPIGVLGMTLAALYIADIREKSVARLDIKGTILSGVGLACLVFAFEAGTKNALPPKVMITLLVVGLVGVTLYYLHSRRVENPVIDMSLFRIPATSATLIGGTFFRAGVGAMPFLLPLLFQIGFGMSPLYAGSITMVSGLGAFAMKTWARAVLRRFGFRTALSTSTLFAAIFMAANALFTPTTPHLVIILVLFLGGFARSFQFAAMNALCFCDVPQSRMSHATSLNGMVQQLSMSLGVGTGAMMLSLMLWSHGQTHLVASDFPPVFLALGVITLFPLWQFARLSTDIGADVSGHVSRAAKAPLPASRAAE